MSDVKLIVNVHCHRPEWAITNPIEKFNDVRYRLYVNDELFTERTWSWPNNYLLLETLWAANNQQTYTIHLEPVTVSPSQAKFRLENMKITNFRYQTVSVSDQSITVQLV